MAALPNYAPMTDRRRRKLAKAEAKRAPIISDTHCWCDQPPLNWQLAQVPAPQLLLAAPPPLKLLPALCESTLAKQLAWKEQKAAICSVLVAAAEKPKSTAKERRIERRKAEREAVVSSTEWAAFVRSKGAPVAMSAAEGL